MKFPFLSKKFKAMDIVLVLFIWMLWDFFYGAYLSGELHVRIVDLSREEDPLLFWPLLGTGALAVIYFIYCLIFKEIPDDPPEYDHHGNIDKK